MLEFILEYWIEFLFTGVVTVLGFLGKYFFSLVKKQFREEREEFYEKITAETDRKLTELKEETNVKIEALVAETQALKYGLLSVQGKLFREECYRLLEEGHVITLDEYEQLEDDHTAYNGLGGNHNGDMLYGLATQKFEDTLTKGE